MTNRNSDALNEQILENLTEEQLQELKDLYVERLVDNMSTKDLVRYVFDDMTDYVDKQSPVEFFDDAYSYFDDYFDELVEEVASFPNGEHDDLVDSMTQALMRYRQGNFVQLPTDDWEDDDNSVRMKMYY